MHKTKTCIVRRTAGVSLLEVVLALAILGIATAYLAQSMQLAAENAIRAKLRTRAELVADSVMNQVVAGVLPVQSTGWAPYNSANATSQWMYQLQQFPVEVENMLGIQVAVQEIQQDGLNRAEADLVVNRWIIDPNLGLDVLPEETTEEGEQ